MGKRRAEKPPEPARPFHHPFAGLAERLGMTPQAERPDPAPGEREGAPPARPEPGSGAGRAHGQGSGGVGTSEPSGPGSGRAPAAGPARAVVRLERKGRGGKEATVVEKLDLPAAERERWLRELKTALGCGGAVEGAALVLQGDLRPRVKAWLEGRGVRKVTVG